MRAPSKKTISFIAGVAATGAVVGATLPASAADKGDTKSTHVASHKSFTGSAATAAKGAAPKASNGLGSQLVTGNVCSAYGDGRGDLCMWYFSGYGGSSAGFLRNDTNLNDDRFFSAGSGQGAIVNNNAESVWNYDRVYTAYVATSPGFTGSVGYVRASTGGNFAATYKNNVESLYWAS